MKDLTIKGSLLHCSSEGGFTMPVNPGLGFSWNHCNIALNRASHKWSSLSAPSSSNISACLWTESLTLLQFVPESELSLIEQSSRLHKQQSNRKKINGSRGMEKRDTIDLSAIDSPGSLHCALWVKCTLSANWWGWVWKGVKWLEDTEVVDDNGGSQRWQGRRSRLEREQGHGVSNRRRQAW